MKSSKFNWKLHILYIFRVLISKATLDWSLQTSSDPENAVRFFPKFLTKVESSRHFCYWSPTQDDSCCYVNPYFFISVLKISHFNTVSEHHFILDVFQIFISYSNLTPVSFMRRITKPTPEDSIDNLLLPLYSISHSSTTPVFFPLNNFLLNLQFLF